MRRRYTSPLAQTSQDRNVDMNPMLDVVFILLIFFIVTAVFVREQGIDINPSDKSTGEPGKSIVVTIGAKDRIEIDNKYVDVRQVRGVLTQLNAQRPEAGVVVSTQDTSSVDALVRVMDSARSAGIYNISFAQ